MDVTPFSAVAALTARYQQPECAYQSHHPPLRVSSTASIFGRSCPELDGLCANYHHTARKKGECVSSLMQEPMERHKPLAVLDSGHARPTLYSGSSMEIALHRDTAGYMINVRVDRARATRSRKDGHIRAQKNHSAPRRSSCTYSRAGTMDVYLFSRRETRRDGGGS